MDKRISEMIAGYVDGELAESDRLAFEQELSRNEELRSEVEEFRKLKEVTDVMRYADLPEEVWETYWQSIYRKLERGIGWIFLSIGAIILGSIGVYELFQGFFLNPEAPFVFKIGVGALAIGLIVLLISAGRERLFAFNRDRYKEVNR